MLEFRDKIKLIKGVGDAMEKKFAKIGIFSVADLLFHFPFRYESFSMPSYIKDAYVNEVVSVEGLICKTPSAIKTAKGSIVETAIKDSTGIITLRWFNQPYVKSKLHFNDHLIVRGKLEKRGNYLTITQPELYTKEKYRECMKTFKPIYHVTEGLNQATIRKAIGYALDETLIKDYLPRKVLNDNSLLALKEALMDIHFPKDKETLTRALSRMIYNEFFIFFTNMRILQENEVVHKNNYKIVWDERAEKILNSLSFSLTNDQEKALNECLSDLTGEKPMQRLLQGDVGSGKTAIALLLLAVNALNGYQGCLMAPTEVLALQHYEYFISVLEPFGIKTAYLTGSMKKSLKTAVLKELEAGEVDIVIGTHAAISENVEFKNLSLNIIDEQHRFGVKQRDKLAKKGEYPHLLLMTATPIPRTYALMLYGGMDVSVIKEKPANRLPIKNCVVGNDKRALVDSFINKQIALSHQVYIICPLIEESESLEAASVNEYTVALKNRFDNNIRIASLSGKMKNEEKNEIMASFERGEIDILVSTTVIEVGINVPNATLMVIENAERFGLASLHQIRGRVGRGKDQSYCIFINGNGSDASTERLNILANSNDGFEIASKDMTTRGPGDFFGVRQSGDFNFSIADPIRDAAILSDAKNLVDSLSVIELKNIYNNIDFATKIDDSMVY